MTGCSGCFNYTTTEGRVNAIAVDPTTTTNGSIVAYLGAVGGGVWKTTNCCSDMTTWTAVTDDPLISTAAIDTVVIDPNNHNTIYAGTGDLNFGSFSMGSQGILKSTDAGATWTTLGADVFGKPLDGEHVHRPELVSALSGAPVGTPITPEIVASVLAHPEGGRKGVPRNARVIVVINKVESLPDKKPARETAERLLREPAIRAVVLAAVRGDDPVLEVCSR